MNLKAERNLIKKGYLRIIGLDEAGRGAWAGPLVAGCVMVDDQLDLRKKQYAPLRLINDSKKLSSPIREKIFTNIKQLLQWSVGIVSVSEIEKLGINQANKLALIRAANNLENKYNFALVDYWSNLSLPVPQQSFIKADSRFFSVAAASIVAKVYRDHLMLQLSKNYQSWHFAQHKGYGTDLHHQAIVEHGFCKHHRISFLHKFTSK